MSRKKVKLTTQYVVIVCIMLLAVNVGLGMILMSQSGRAMKALINRHLIAVAETAAASLDGDQLKVLTADDVDSETYKQIEATLVKIKNAQKDNDIKYIYTVTKSVDGYIFTVDPDPIAPALFGEEVVYTPEEDIAWNGVSAVERQPHTDKWGVFYTAWSPIRDSFDNVIGLVGVDFVPDWYDRQVASHTVSVIASGCMSLAVGALMMLLLTGQLRRRIRSLNAELITLSGDVDRLSDEILVRPGDEDIPMTDVEYDAGSNTIGALSEKIKVMQRQLKEYLDYVHEQAYTDTMTGVGNKTAYLDYVKDVNRRINEGTAAFAVVVFDVNGLKNTNDNFGHECGDQIIRDAAATICRVFSSTRIYRIGGDEFIAVTDSASESELNDKFKQLEDEIDSFNKTEKKYAMNMSFSWGGALYRPGVDSDFKAVFKRADEAMYRNKENYYSRYGGVVRHYE